MQLSHYLSKPALTMELLELKRKVFIVDDHPIVQNGLTQLINGETDLIVCGTASTLTSAFQLMTRCKPDAAIIDISLEKISGIGLVEELVRHDANLPILVFSVHDDSLYAERSLRAGARGYVMKTAPLETIVAALRTVLKGNLVISEHLQNSFLNKLVSSRKKACTPPVTRLSNRELEIFQLTGQGIRTQQIAKRLKLSVKTIETYINHIKQKMNLKSYHDFLIYAARWVITERMM